MVEFIRVLDGEVVDYGSARAVEDDSTLMQHKHGVVAIKVCQGLGAAEYHAPWARAGDMLEQMGHAMATNVLRFTAYVVHKALIQIYEQVSTEQGANRRKSTN